METGTTADTWLKRIGALNVDRDDQLGVAPHKPLLLLAVLDLVENGRVTDGRVDLSPELVRRFRELWPIVAIRRRNRGEIRMPFHALGSRRDQVWTVLDKDGRPSAARATTVSAQLPGDLTQHLGDPVFREAVRRRLVATYFEPLERAELERYLGFTEAVHEPELDTYRTEREAYVNARRRKRDAAFKNLVPVLYAHTCALTGYRLTLAGERERELVEAAHIEAHRLRGNDALTNGLALTPTAHTLFDLGLWSVADDLRILVKPAADFREESPAGGFSLRAQAGRRLHIIPSSPVRPAPEYLAWHRREHGFGG